MNEVGKIARKSGDCPPSRRRRHKRFHRPAQALGDGYEWYDVTSADPSTASTGTTTAVASAVLEASSEAETKRLISRRGMRWCGWGFLVVLVVWHYKWIWHLYLAAARAWPGLYGQ